MVQIKGLAEVLANQPLFEGFDVETMKFLESCAANEAFQEGEYLFRVGEPADRFFLLREGAVALELQIPGRTRLTVHTLDPGQIVGTSWLLPPYKMGLDARALKPVRAITIDAHCLRGKFDADPILGYQMVKRFLPIVADRLQGARLQLLDLYAS